MKRPFFCASDGVSTPNLIIDNVTLLTALILECMSASCAGTRWNGASNAE